MSKMQQVIDYAREHKIIRAKDIESEGIHRETLKRLTEQGILIHSARGIYTFAEAQITENHTLAQTAKRFSGGVVCLLSALSFYEITTQTPFEVWFAVPQTHRPLKDSLLPIRTVYMSGKSLDEGIEEYLIEGVKVQIYCLAKTVIDCFKFRNKIGLDVAIEALQDSWRERRCSIDELWHYAKICRVHNVICPYLNSL